MALDGYPGVYVFEVPSGVRPIGAASTSTAAFVGVTERGPTDEAKRITSWTEFQKHYGTFFNGSFLAESVFQFFNNGGRQCYIVRIEPTAPEDIASVTVQNRASTPKNGLVFYAKNAGDWGNYLYLQIEDGSADPYNTFKISVRKQDNKAVVPEDFKDINPIEVHDNLSINPDSPNYVVNVLESKSILIDAEVHEDNTSLQSGFYLGGWITPGETAEFPLGVNRSFQINIDNDSIDDDSFPVITIPEASTSDEETLEWIAGQIQAEVQKLSPQKGSTLGVAFQDFKCKTETGSDGKVRLKLISGTNGPNDSIGSDKSSVRIKDHTENNAAEELMLGANRGTSVDAIAVRRPAKAGAIQIGDAAIEGPVTSATLGKDPKIEDVTTGKYRDGFDLLNNKTDFSILAVPGVGTPAIVNEGMSYCAKRPLKDVFYIGEMPDSYTDPADAESFRDSLTNPNSYGAVYFPWIKALDPSGKSDEPVLLPPSGFIAGLYARIDANRGVWKAPAGTEASIRGAVGLKVDLTDMQQGNLNEIKHVNCIRRFTASGIVSWGAKTISPPTSEYKYLPVRRMAIMLRVSIYNGIQWAVFEPNDTELWGQLRLNINSFMMTLFRQGAFQGSSPSEAFYVKCDSETTSQGEIDKGIVNILVGFAPLKPAEFVVVKISQKAGQSS